MDEESLKLSEFMGVNIAGESEAAQVAEVVQVKRGRGRPKGSKNKTYKGMPRQGIDYQRTDAGQVAGEVQIKKGRGRPKGSKNKSNLKLEARKIAEGQHNGNGKTSANYGEGFDGIAPSGRRSSLPVQVAYKTHMTKIESTSNFHGKYIKSFTGENFADAVSQAHKWEENNGIKLLDYFEQQTFGKTILASYNIKEDKE